MRRNPPKDDVGHDNDGNPFHRFTFGIFLSSRTKRDLCPLLCDLCVLFIFHVVSLTRLRTRKENSWIRSNVVVIERVDGGRRKRVEENYFMLNPSFWRQRAERWRIFKIFFTHSIARSVRVALCERDKQLFSLSNIREEIHEIIQQLNDENIKMEMDFRIKTTTTAVLNLMWIMLRATARAMKKLIEFVH